MRRHKATDSFPLRCTAFHFSTASTNLSVYECVCVQTLMALITGYPDPDLSVTVDIARLFFIAVRRTSDLTTVNRSLLRTGPEVARLISYLPLAGRQPELLFSASASLRADEFKKLMESERRGRVVTSICYTCQERFIWNVSRLWLFSIGTRPLALCVSVASWTFK